jgi:hypothetical protein
MRRSFIIGIALVLLAGTGASAEPKPKTQHVSCAFSATFDEGTETHIDTNNNGISASLLQGIANCNIGRLFFREAYEFNAALPAPVTCPAGTAEFHLQQDHGVDTEEKTSDQLFYEFGPNGAISCVNFATLTFTFTSHGTYTGGTGQFAEATGSFDTHGTGSFRVVGSKDGVDGDFGQLSGTLTGALTLPKGAPDEQDED